MKKRAGENPAVLPQTPAEWAPGIDVLTSVNAALHAVQSPWRIDLKDGQAIAVPTPEVHSSLMRTPEERPHEADGAVEPRIVDSDLGALCRIPADGTGSVDTQVVRAKGLEVTPPAQAIRALLAQWRCRADGIIEDVNNGHAPSHEADVARGWQHCADELEPLLAALLREAEKKETT